MASHLDSSFPGWVCAAGELPVAFAQVREDALVDARVVARLGPHARLTMIASGGCTLAYLAACSRAARIEVVDPNPAQIALARLKLHLLQNACPSQRLALLGHTYLPVAERGRRLCEALRDIGVSTDAIGPARAWSVEGPDHCGRYERVFVQLRKELAAQRGALEELLRLRDPAEQSRRVDPAAPLGRALDEAFDRAMDLPILIRLFGEGATRNRIEPFARHFARRTRHVLATLPAADNPYLWQVLAGCYPPGVAAPWFAAPAPDRLPEITWSTTVMTEALRRSPRSYDFVHLSNILDWLSPAEARATLEFAHSALRPGGWTLVRQLNSTLDILLHGAGFVWHTDEGEALHASDRSYFYRGVYLGRKR